MLLDRKQVKIQAKEALENVSYSPRKLVLIHSGVALAATLLTALLTFLLSHGIGNTGGLSGIGTRTLLETAQSTLSLGVSLLLPFWEAGMVFAAILWAKREAVAPQSLLQGFRRFGPVLRLLLVRMLLYFGVSMVCMNASVIIGSFFPLPAEFEQLAMELAQSSTLDPQAILEKIPMDVLLRGSLPILIVFFATYIVGIILVSYHLRLADYMVLDDPQMGAFAAVRESFRRMRGNCLELFKLDLSFWWFFLLQALAAVLANADMLLPVIGISLPISSDIAFFVCALVSSAAQLAIYCWARHKIECTYACAYLQLQTTQQ